MKEWLLGLKRSFASSVQLKKSLCNSLSDVVSLVVCIILLRHFLSLISKTSGRHMRSCI